MLLTVWSTLFGSGTIPVGIIWQAIFLALIFGSLQYAIFSDSIFPKMQTPGRMITLCVSMLVVLSVFALIFRPFDIGAILHWLVFIGLYVVVFAIATIALRIVFHVGELKYNDLLTAYKSRNNN